MIQVESFYEELQKYNIDFFAGVPDSLLKDVCAYITYNTPAQNHIITANEGGAIALGVGYHMATNKIPLIYMQNSGLGNAVNPLLSLVDPEVYSIPMLLMIGWRGEPGIKDEPQHIKQGRVTLHLLKSMEIPYFIFDADCNFKELLQKSIALCIENSGPVALVIRKSTFSEYKLINKNNQNGLSREEALETVIKNLPGDAIVISTTGMLSRELFELREKYHHSHESDFLTVGSMGHASQIALGIAMSQPNKNVYCFEGDGALLMHLGHYAITSSICLKNLKIVLFNNGAHDSVGGQPTIAQGIDLSKVMAGFGIKYFGKALNNYQISSMMMKLAFENTISFLEIEVRKGNRKDLGRPTIKPIDNKVNIKNYLLQ